MGTINDYGEFAFWQEGFKISDEQAHEGRPNTRYFGYVNREGHWHIMRVDYDTPKEYRFTMGKTNYETNWGIRESLIYRRFHLEFR